MCTTVKEGGREECAQREKREGEPCRNVTQTRHREGPYTRTVRTVITRFTVGCERTVNPIITRFTVGC